MAAVPDLLDHLRSEYLAQAQAAGPIERRVVDAFVDFARGYLADHPPQSVFYPDVGVGVRLRNGVSVTLAPRAAAAGPGFRAVQVTPPVPGPGPGLPAADEPATPVFGG